MKGHCCECIGCNPAHEPQGRCEMHTDLYTGKTFKAMNQYHEYRYLAKEIIKEVKKVKIALIGRGAWGANIERVLKSLRVDYEVFDIKDGKTIHAAKDCEACIIATPANTHFINALIASQQGKHILIEKPMCTNVEEARLLVKLVDFNNKILMVGHQFLYNGGIIKLKELIKNNELGKIYYMYSQRLKLGKVRDDADILWTFAPHDISIFNYLLDSCPRSVTCHGWNYITNKADVAFLTLSYSNNVNCHVHISWLDKNKTRKIVIVGEKQTAVFDDLIEAPENGEPLKNEIKEFINCIETNRQPIANGLNGLQVVKVLEACQKSMQNNGEVVKL
jgi:UDP-2-acetamido-3-amino-2,3-dideoxy-glucuronate N-acetyltransferase